MNYHFPPPPPVTTSTVILHVALLGLLLASIAALFVKSRRPAKVRDLFLWALAGAAAAGFCMAGTAENEHYAPFLTGYMLLVWLICGIAWVMTAVRLYRSGHGPSVTLVLSSLLGLGVLIMCSLPAVPAAREAARRMQCSNNLKQLGLAMLEWHDKHHRLPDATTSDEGQPPHSWRVTLLPYLENEPLYEVYDASRAWDDPLNLPVARTSVSMLQCPSNPNGRDVQQRYFTAYAAVTGDNTNFPNGRGLALREVTDGASNTFLLNEACGQEIVWTEPRDLDAERDNISVNSGSPKPTHSPSVLSSYHPNGALVVLADGSVRFIAETIDPNTLRALLTATADDDVTDF